MSEKKAKPEANGSPAPVKTGGGLASKLVIAGFMGGVVLVECALAYFMIPSAEHVAAIAEENLQKKLPAALHPPEEGHGEAPKPEVELDLGQFSVTVTRPNAPTVLRVDFQLVGIVEEENATEGKAAFDRNVNRFRDMVISEIRHLETSDFADPGLGLIKRRILEKVNALFGKPLLKSIVFPDFSYFEQ